MLLYIVQHLPISGGASAVKEPGHLKKILQPGHPDAFFSLKKLTFFTCRPQNTGRQRRFIVKIKQSGQIW